jgi:parallel beta-helix repeat protein
VRHETSTVEIRSKEMEAKRSRMKPAVIALALGSMLVFLAFSMAGDSGPGAPTVPALDLLADDHPIESLPFVIDQPGSYHLTQNLTHTGQSTNAIEVNADNVTIDLGGYSLIGPGANSGTSNGIHMNGRTNVEICHGTVTGFGNNGIYEENNDAGSGHRVVGVRVLSNGGHGILLWGAYHTVRDCTATENCLALIQGYGAITCGSTSTVTGNVASNNNIVGINTGSGCMICDNTVSGNAYGIAPWYGCSVIDNTVSYNGVDGIQVAADGSLIKGNTLSGNTESGIYVSGSYNSVEENLVTYSGVGIDFASAENVYANNRALANAQNYGGSVPSGSRNGGGNVAFGTLPGANINALQKLGARTSVSKTLNGK